MQDPAGESEVFAGTDDDKILDQACVISLSAGGKTEDFRDIYKQNFRIFRGDHVHHHRLSRHTGISLGKNFSGFDQPQDTGISPDIIILDLGSTRQHDPNIRHRFPGSINRRIPNKPPGRSPKPRKSSSVSEGVYPRNKEVWEMREKSINSHS